MHSNSSEVGCRSWPTKFVLFNWISWSSCQTSGSTFDCSSSGLSGPMRLTSSTIAQYHKYSNTPLKCYNSGLQSWHYCITNRGGILIGAGWDISPSLFKTMGVSEDKISQGFDPLTFPSPLPTWEGKPPDITSTWTHQISKRGCAYGSIRLQTSATVKSKCWYVKANGLSLISESLYRR